MVHTRFVEPASKDSLAYVLFYRRFVGIRLYKRFPLGAWCNIDVRRSFLGWPRPTNSAKDNTALLHQERRKNPAENVQLQYDVSVVGILCHDPSLLGQDTPPSPFLDGGILNRSIHPGFHHRPFQSSSHCWILLDLTNQGSPGVQYYLSEVSSSRLVAYPFVTVFRKSVLLEMSFNYVTIMIIW